jgi:GT2 family glycosyltransferase
MDRVNAVIVTYNRLALLQECVEAVLLQTFPPGKIIIVNNASTDGTKDYLATLPSSQFVVINQEKNTGGAGGFNTGMKKSVEIGADWTWLMDDDTIPNADALEKLMLRSSIVPNTGFMCSRVLWTDGSAHKMNICGHENLIHDVPMSEYLDEGIILCRNSSFVSCLIKQQAIETVGFPIMDFFIWADDFEYTLRIFRAGFFGAFVIDSIAIHKTKKNYISSLKNASPDLFWRFFYDERNKVYIIREGKSFSLKYIYKYLKMFYQDTGECLKNRNGRFRLLFIVLKGLFAGIFFYPKVEN